MSQTYSESTYYREELFGRSQRLTIMLQVNLFLLTWKFLTYLAFTLFKWVFLCTYITMVHCLFPLHTFFKLEVRSINTQPDTVTSTYLILVEPISKKLSILFQGPRIWNSLPNNIKAAPTFNVFKRLIKLFLRVRQNVTYLLNITTTTNYYT